MDPDIEHALALHQRGQRADAEHIYNAVLERTPDAPDALHFLGVLMIETGRAAKGVALIQSALKHMPNDAAAHSDLGWGFSAMGRHQDAIAMLNRALALDPGRAPAFNNRGAALNAMGRRDEALADFGKALALSPGYAQAHYNRAVTLHEMERHQDALPDFDTAIALEPNFAKAFNNRGLALLALGRASDALASFDRAIALRRRHGEAHHNRALALRALSRFDEAIEAYRAAAALNPNLVGAHFNQGLALLTLGRFAEGWPLYEWRAKRPGSGAARTFDAPRWTGAEPLTGKTLFLHWEQGFGDTIQAIRYAPMAQARGARVVVSVQKQLTRLFQQYAPRAIIVGEGTAPTAFDFHCPLMSLPGAFATSVDAIPAPRRYLAANVPLSAELRTRLPKADKLRIGVAWSGSANHPNDKERSLSLNALEPLLGFDAHWIAVQTEVREADTRALAHLRKLHAFPELLTDFADTAALISELDLVITVDTAAAHLSAALGKPTWIMVHHASDWRWLLDREDSPWYPTARLFRQSADLRWAPVIARVREELGRFER